MLEERQGIELVSVPVRGVDCFQGRVRAGPVDVSVSVPVWGVDCFGSCRMASTGSSRFRPREGWVNRLAATLRQYREGSCFRPRVGCGLLRSKWTTRAAGLTRFRPRMGWGLLLFGAFGLALDLGHVSVPVWGVDCFRGKEDDRYLWPEFPSPCGVWVASRA